MNNIKRYSDRIASSQTDKMKKTVLKIFGGSLFMLGLGWMALYTIFGKDFFWKSGFIAGGIEMLFVAAGLVLIRTKFIQKASRFHLFLTIIYLPLIVCFLDAFSRVILYLYASKGWVTIAFEIILLIIVFWIQVRRKKTKLRIAIDRNVKVGKLDLVTGEWDLTIPTKFGTVEMEKSSERLTKNLEYILPFAPLIGMMMNRNLPQNRMFEVLGYIMFTFAIALAWGVAAQHLAVAFQLLDWEKETGRKITLSREKAQ